MDALGTSDIFLFEPFRLDRRGLFRREEGGGFVPLNLGSRAADILRTLVERAGELVSKEEIIAAVWPGTVVEDSNLTVQISALRRFLDERPAERSYIQAVPGRGYRFVATVTRLQPLGATVSASEAVAGSLDLAFLDLGEQQVENIARPFHVGRIALERIAKQARRCRRCPRSRRSRCCRSRTCQVTPNRSISSTVWSKRSLPHSPAFAGCS